MVFKIKQINPVCSEIWEKPNLELLQKFKNPDTEIYISTIKEGPEEISCAYDGAKAINYALEEAEKAQSEGFNAVAMSCFLDVGLDAMREILDIPVVGACQAALHLASLLGTKISIITSNKNGGTIRAIEDLVNKYGFKSKLASIRKVNLTPLQFAVEKQKLKKELLVEAKKAIREDKADVIILGCSGMNVAPWLQEQINIPVVDPLIAVIKILEVLGKMHLSHSKLAYPKP
jgi:allantoin racemase